MPLQKRRYTENGPAIQSGKKSILRSIGTTTCFTTNAWIRRLTRFSNRSKPESRSKKRASRRSPPARGQTSIGQFNSRNGLTRGPRSAGFVENHEWNFAFLPARLRTLRNCGQLSAVTIAVGAADLLFLATLSGRER